MKNVQIILLVLFCASAQLALAQVENKVYEINITTTDKDGNTEVKELVIEGDMSQSELDALIQEHIDANAEEVDVNVNVNVTKEGEENREDAKTITKIIKQRSNLGDEEKIILEEQDMEIEVKGDKVYINGEEVKEGEFGDKKVRILKFEEGDDFELEELLENENIEIGEGEKIYFIEKEESKEGIAFLGVTVGSSNGSEGVKVFSVVEGTSAEKMGLKEGDKLISINGNEVNSYSELSKVVKAYLPGEKVKVVYEREGETNEAEVELSDYSEYQSNPRTWSGTRTDRRRGHRRKHHKGDPNKTFLGVVYTENDGAVIVDEIRDGSPAEKAGIQIGDQIIAVDKEKLENEDQFSSIILGHKPGDEIKLKVIRDGKKKKVKATLDAMQNVMGRKYPMNKSQRIERIVIKDKRDLEREDLETRGAIKISDFTLSPNPSPGNLRVGFSMDELKNDEALVIRIVSLDGKILREEKMSEFNGQYLKDFDLSDLGQGIYLFQVEKNSQKFIKRFVIERD